MFVEYGLLAGLPRNFHQDKDDIDIRGVIELKVEDPMNFDGLNRQINEFTLDEVGSRNLSISIIFDEADDVSKYVREPDYL